MKPLKADILHFLRGVLMGAADIIPGVSGGTMAFITGIYERLVTSIRAIDVPALRLLWQGRWQALWTQVNGRFLLALFVGILLAVFTLTKFIKYLLEHHPIPLWAFFFGLILASAWVVGRHIRTWNITTTICLLGGVAVSYWITSTALIYTPDTLPYVFMSGFIAITAMILPGISGSYILLILDKYAYIVGLVAELPARLKGWLSGELPLEETGIWPVGVFMLGAVCGLLFFARILHWLLHRFYAPTMALLTGFMLGSLHKVWPWKTTLQWYTNRHGEQAPLIQQNTWPPAWDTPFFTALALALAGGLLVVVLYRIAQAQKSDP